MGSNIDTQIRTFSRRLGLGHFALGDEFPTLMGRTRFAPILAFERKIRNARSGLPRQQYWRQRLRLLWYPASPHLPCDKKEVRRWLLVKLLKGPHPNAEGLRYAKATREAALSTRRVPLIILASLQESRRVRPLRSVNSRLPKDERPQHGHAPLKFGRWIAPVDILRRLGIGRASVYRILECQPT